MDWREILGGLFYQMPIFAFKVLFAFLLIRNPATNAFIPEARKGHTAALMNGTIYFHGGDLADNTQSSQLFTLNVSEKFDTSTSQLPFTDLTSQVQGRPFNSSWGCSGGFNGTLLVMPPADAPQVE